MRYKSQPAPAHRGAFSLPLALNLSPRPAPLSLSLSLSLSLCPHLSVRSSVRPFIHPVGACIVRANGRASASARVCLVRIWREKWALIIQTAFSLAQCRAGQGKGKGGPSGELSLSSFLGRLLPEVVTQKERETHSFYGAVHLLHRSLFLSLSIEWTPTQLSVKFLQ